MLRLGYSPTCSSKQRRPSVRIYPLSQVLSNLQLGLSNRVVFATSVNFQLENLAVDLCFRTYMTTAANDMSSRNESRISCCNCRCC
ncbi:hypothetical protein Ocin01_06055 [Orchesella cincta]|uniref:Uncharacterized protein n=1 Tax=Orchesella cincta TaxID=48709 RepID=A0A1D2N5S1_ORCCI|nr:hypothetical protein Ocin01_06055 [Orchesella cincta]